MHVIGAHDYDHGRLEQNVYIYYLSRDYKLIIIVWIRSADDCDKMRSAGGHELALRTTYFYYTASTRCLLLPLLLLLHTVERASIIRIRKYFAQILAIFYDGYYH